MSPTPASARRPRRSWSALLTVLVTLLVTLPLQALAPPASAAWATGEDLLPAGHRISGQPLIAYDGTNRAYAMWARFIDGWTYEVHLRERPAGGPWGPDQVVVTSSQSQSYIHSLDMDVNARGEVVISWRGNAVHAMRRPASGEWGPIVSWNSPGTAGPASGCPNAPAIDVGDDGTAVVAWTSYQSCNGVVSQWRVMAAAYSPDRGWEAAPQVWDVSDSDVHSKPGVGVDSAGRATVAFTARNADMHGDLWSAQNVDGTWQAPERRGGSGYGPQGTSPAVATRGHTTSVAWYQGSALWSTSVDSGGPWTAPRSVGGTVSTDHLPPGLALDAGGAVHLGWARQHSTGVQALVTTLRPDGGTTETAMTPAGTNGFNVQVAADGAGSVAAVWDQVSGGSWSALTALRPAGGAWPSSADLVTTGPFGNSTLPQIAMDGFGHVLVAAVPVQQGFGVGFQVALETRDPATEPASPPVISPATAAAGDTVTCGVPAFGGTGPFSYAYQWLRAGVELAGATGASYSVRADDAGQPLTCRVTATNEAGSASSTSEELVVGVTPPRFTSTTTMTGTVEAGSTVTCVPGTVSGAPTPELALEWLRNGAAIPFENADTYVIPVEDAGASLACRATATNDGGSDVSASVAKSVPAVAGPVLVTAPSVSGPTSAGIGSTLTCSRGTWTGAPAPTYSHEWLRDGLVIDDAYSPAYTVTASDAGTTLTCQVTAENVAGATSAASSNNRVIPPPRSTPRCPSCAR